MPSALTRPLTPRSTTEEHRAATPLELFFDLCFVVAVAQAAGRLHHALAEDNLAHALVSYPAVFFAIWWAWMNFTWFASAYDNDDIVYRLTSLVQIAGVLVLAAGVPRAFDDNDFGVVTLGYLIMRAALVAQWLRAAHADPSHRRTAQRYALGVAVCMVGWIALLALPEDWRGVGWLVMVPAELLVPVWAERANMTTWHPEHIVERFGLFTLIVLGESVLAATVALQAALDTGAPIAQLLVTAGGGLLIVFSMWWLYFAQPSEEVVGRARSVSEGDAKDSFIWGYGHLLVFASAAAVGAGLAVASDQANDHAELSARGAALAVAVPVALFLVSVWALHARKPDESGRQLLLPAAAVVVLAAAAATQSILVVGLLLAAVVTKTSEIETAPAP